MKKGYKGEKACQTVLLTEDEEILFQFLQKKGKEDNNLELYYEKDKIDKLHKAVGKIHDLKQRLSSSSLSKSQRKRMRAKIKNQRKKKNKLIKNYFKKKKPAVFLVLVFEEQMKLTNENCYL